MRMTLAGHIASLLIARENCRTSGNAEWFQRHTDALETIEREFLPSGSGIDSGTTIDLAKSKPDRIILQAGYHHMADSGMYDGWTEHRITVRPAFSGLELTIGGRNRNDIKSYLHDVYAHALTIEYIHTADGFELAA